MLLDVKTIAIVPYPTLGDITICIRLAQILNNAEYQVTLYADSFISAQHYFEWLNILPLTESAEDLLSTFDLCLLDILAPWVQRNLKQLQKNSHQLLFFTAKDFPRNLMINLTDDRGALINRPFCLDSSSTLCMIDWVDDYAKKVFGATAPRGRPLIKLNESETKQLKVVIFPTTPNPKKNFSTRKFYQLAQILSRQGRTVEFVGLPQEQEKFQRLFSGFSVRTFLQIADLIEYLNTSEVVISNDSGGGHLAAMLGVPTITITRKDKSFVWRPGYGLGYVASPFVTFKFGDGHIWQPFISLTKIKRRVLTLCEPISLNKVSDVEV